MLPKRLFKMLRQLMILPRQLLPLSVNRLQRVLPDSSRKMAARLHSRYFRMKHTASIPIWERRKMPLPWKIWKVRSIILKNVTISVSWTVGRNCSLLIIWWQLHSMIQMLLLIQWIISPTLLSERISPGATPLRTVYLAAGMIRKKNSMKRMGMQLQPVIISISLMQVIRWQALHSTSMALTVAHLVRHFLLALLRVDIRWKNILLNSWHTTIVWWKPRLWKKLPKPNWMRRKKLWNRPALYWILHRQMKEQLLNS